MSNYGPSSAFIIVGGRDLSPLVFDLNDSAEGVISQTNGLGVSWEEHKPVGIARCALETGNGLYDDDAAGNVEAFQGMGATSQLLAFGYEGKAIDADVSMVEGLYSNVWKRITSRDDLTLGKATHKISGALYPAKVIHGATARTTAGNSQTTSVDNAASSANGGYFDCHILDLELGGYTNVVIKVRHSVDNVTFTDLATFTAFTTENAAERQTVAGTINRYLAISWAWTGAGSSQTVTPFVVGHRIA